LLRASDDWIAATVARPDDRASLPAWLGVDPAAPCVLTNASPWAEIARRVATRESDDVIESANALGLACARVGEVGRSAAVLAQRLGDAPSLPLAGVRVANLASLWAGPLAAAALTRLGADVVSIESTRRPDGARATPAWFDVVHAGQRSVAIDFGSDEGLALLAELLSAADVVIEGSRPRALRQLGIAAEELVRRGPRVWLSITSYGRDPANEMRVGFGDDAAAAGALVGWVGDAPVFVADALADPLTGLVAAATITDLLEGGGRWLVDVALARVAAELAPRPSDPVVHAAPEASPPPWLGTVTPPFELGAHTDAVVRDWLDR
jgi:crotonobetainyl-CoA:carnitine CoA-transferase CaiB-like acyl-CoA transferase